MHEAKHNFLYSKMIVQLMTPNHCATPTHSLTHSGQQCACHLFHQYRLTNVVPSTSKQPTNLSNDAEQLIHSVNSSKARGCSAKMLAHTATNAQPLEAIYTQCTHEQCCCMYRGSNKVLTNPLVHNIQYISINHGDK